MFAQQYGSALERASECARKLDGAQMKALVTTGLPHFQIPKYEKDTKILANAQQTASPAAGHN
jgi:hypothetical protein